MNKLDFAKKAVSIVVGAGAAQIVKGFIQNNTNPEGVKDKIAIASAAVVLGSMMSEATSKHTGKMIDDAVDLVKTVVETVKKKTEETSEELEKSEED